MVLLNRRDSGSLGPSSGWAGLLRPNWASAASANPHLPDLSCQNIPSAAPGDPAPPPRVLRTHGGLCGRSLRGGHGPGSLPPRHAHIQVNTRWREVAPHYWRRACSPRSPKSGSVGWSMTFPCLRERPHPSLVSRTVPHGPPLTLALNPFPEAAAAPALWRCSLCPSGVDDIVCSLLQVRYSPSTTGVRRPWLPDQLGPAPWHPVTWGLERQVVTFGRRSRFLCLPGLSLPPGPGSRGGAPLPSLSCTPSTWSLSPRVRRTHPTPPWGSGDTVGTAQSTCGPPTASARQRLLGHAGPGEGAPRAGRPVRAQPTPQTTLQRFSEVALENRPQASSLSLASPWLPCLCP